MKDWHLDYSLSCREKSTGRDKTPPPHPQYILFQVNFFLRCRCVSDNAAISCCPFGSLSSGFQTLLSPQYDQQSDAVLHVHIKINKNGNGTSLSSSWPIDEYVTMTLFKRTLHFYWVNCLIVVLWQIWTWFLALVTCRNLSLLFYMS